MKKLCVCLLAAVFLLGMIPAMASGATESAPPATFSLSYTWSKENPGAGRSEAKVGDSLTCRLVLMPSAATQLSLLDLCFTYDINALRFDRCTLENGITAQLVGNELYVVRTDYANPVNVTVDAPICIDLHFTAAAATGEDGTALTLTAGEASIPGAELGTTVTQGDKPTLTVAGTPFALSVSQTNSTLNITMTDSMSAGSEVFVFAAAYDANGRMLETKSASPTLGARGEESNPLPITLTQAGSYYKVFVLDAATSTPTYTARCAAWDSREQTA